MAIVSSFEVLLQPTGPGGGGSTGTGKTATKSASKAKKAKVQDVLRQAFFSPEMAQMQLPFTIPTALQGYFLYVSNLSFITTPTLRVSFVTQDPSVMAARISGVLPYAFLAILNTQPPLLNGNTTTSGILFSGLSVAGSGIYTYAYFDLPPIGPNGTTLFALIPNYLDPKLVATGPVGRGYVDIGTVGGGLARLNVSAQTRVVFFAPGEGSTGTMNTSEAAYSMPSPTGGTNFVVSGFLD
jgi:hypothetical protein